MNCLAMAVAQLPEYVIVVTADYDAIFLGGLRMKVKKNKPLTALMDNVLAWQLGEIALQAGSPSRKDIGDYIDRGLILRRLLDQGGFCLIKKDEI